MADLRSKLIRLAHEHPDLRGEILPLLKEGAEEFPVLQIAKVFDEMEWRVKKAIDTPGISRRDRNSFLKAVKKLSAELSAAIDEALAQPE